MQVFVDTNVLLDVLAERKAFYVDSMRVWTLAEVGTIDAHVAAISFSNCYYLVRKHAGRRGADNAVRLLRGVFKLVELTAQILNQAIDANFADFEDAIQFHSAIQAHAECIITRNPDHFPRKPLSVLSPREFLATHDMP